MFKWAVSRGNIPFNLMDGMETPRAVTPRERWLTDDELRRVWAAAPQTHRCFGPIVRILMLTGQRREEVSGMAWDELFREEREWRIPGTRTENGKPNIAPLSDLVAALINELAGGTAWPRRGRLFCTSTGAGFTAYAKGKTKLDKLIEADGGEPLFP